MVCCCYSRDEQQHVYKTWSEEAFFWVVIVIHTVVVSFWRVKQIYCIDDILWPIPSKLVFNILYNFNYISICRVLLKICIYRHGWVDRIQDNTSPEERLKAETDSSKQSKQASWQEEQEDRWGVIVYIGVKAHDDAGWFFQRSWLYFTVMNDFIFCFGGGDWFLERILPEEGGALHNVGLFYLSTLFFGCKLGLFLYWELDWESRLDWRAERVGVFGYTTVEACEVWEE